MRGDWALCAAIVWGCSLSSTTHRSRYLVDEEFMVIHAPNEPEARFIGAQIALFNSPDRQQQRQAMDRVRPFGLRAVSLLLDALERGHAGAQQGCLELLRDLKKGQERNAAIGEPVPSQRVLAVWYLKELERGYEDLLPPLEIYVDEKREDSHDLRKQSRAVYRQHLCVLFAEVGDARLVDRFLDTFAADKSFIVRSAGYHACVGLATGDHIRRLVDLYVAEKENMPRQYLWTTLKSLTGKHYPDDPGVWQAWLERGVTP